VQVLIKDLMGNELATLKGMSSAGLHKVVWDMRRQLTKEEMEQREGASRFRRRQGELVPPGDYVVVLKVGEKELKRIATVRPMPGT
jgi:hypothetical protein